MEERMSASSGVGRNPYPPNAITTAEVRAVRRGEIDIAFGAMVGFAMGWTFVFSFPAASLSAKVLAIVGSTVVGYFLDPQRKRIQLLCVELFRIHSVYT
jgi:hypothetical protein